MRVASRTIFYASNMMLLLVGVTQAQPVSSDFTVADSASFIIQEGTSGKAKTYASKNKETLVISLGANMAGYTSEEIAELIKGAVQDTSNTGGISLENTAIIHDKVETRGVWIDVFSGARSLLEDGEEIGLEEFLANLETYILDHQARVKARKR